MALEQPFGFFRFNCKKVCHPTLGEANRHKKRLKRRYRGTRSTLRTYFCRVCKAYHVGHEKQNRYLEEKG